MQERKIAGFCAASVLLVAIACSSSGGGGFGDEVNGKGDGGSGVGLGSGDGGQTSGQVHCSSDLHSILNDSNQVIATCPGNEGCAEGKCVPACDAAAANKSSIGCDYLAIPPPFFSGSTACFAAFVANTWGTDVTLTVEQGGQPLNVDSFSYLPQGSGSTMSYSHLSNGVVPAGKVAMVFLSNESAAPCSGNVTAAKGVSALSGSGLGKAFRIKSNAPVVAYDIFPYGGGATAVTSATLLIPTTAFGDNYIGTTAYPANTGTPWLAFAAREDDTQVTISPTNAITAAVGVAGTAKGVPVTYKLNAGDYIKIQQPADLVGSPIQANKPIGSWAGNTCAQVPTGKVACDGLHQQIPPIRSFGSSYVGVHYRDRYDGNLESPPYRIIGAVDGTTLTFTPPVPGAPATIGSGQVVEFRAQNAFVVTSQDDKHPFYLASYMSGCADAIANLNPNDCRGDPEFVNVIPSTQYLASYTFFTDPTYPETNLVFVRGKGKNGSFSDVSLDCKGVLSDWTPITGTDFEWTRVDLVRGNFQKQGNCDNGVHEAKSDAPFGLTVWGWGSAASTTFSSNAVSYGYPAGASVVPINTVVVPAGPK
ncbi:MAG: IgGFc-binding protein [Polyangiaceae bacterium]